MEAGLTEWDRYAAVEYAQLTSGEGGQDDNDEDEDDEADTDDDLAGGFEEQPQHNNNNNRTTHGGGDGYDDLDEQTTEEEDNDNDNDDDSDRERERERGLYEEGDSNVSSRDRRLLGSSKGLKGGSVQHDLDGEDRDSRRHDNNQMDRKEPRSNLSHSFADDAGGVCVDGLDDGCFGGDGEEDDDDDDDAADGLLDAFDARPEVESNREVVRQGGSSGGAGAGVGSGWVDASSVHANTVCDGDNEVDGVDLCEGGRRSSSRFKSRRRSLGIYSFDDVDESSDISSVHTDGETAGTAGSNCAGGTTRMWESDTDHDEDGIDLMLCGGGDMMLNKRQQQQQRQVEGGAAEGQSGIGSRVGAQVSVLDHDGLVESVLASLSLRDSEATLELS
jgi:hypothetical protein